jgi:trehalose 6-phosphate phosphatase
MPCAGNEARLNSSRAGPNESGTAQGGSQTMVNHKPEELSEDTLLRERDLRLLARSQAERMLAHLRDTSAWEAANAKSLRRHGRKAEAAEAEKAAQAAAAKIPAYEAFIESDTLALIALEVERERLASDARIADLSTQARRRRKPSLKGQAAADAQALIAWREWRSTVASRLRANSASAIVIVGLHGVISEIAPSPESAAVERQMRDVLGAMIRRYAVVAVVSGQRAEEAERLVGVPGAVYVGLHGAEVKAPGRPPAIHPALLQWEPRIRRFAQLAHPPLAHLGVRLKLNGPIAAFHWRGAPDPDRVIEGLGEVEREAWMERLATAWDPEGMVMEIRPTSKIDMAMGVQTVLALAAAKGLMEGALYVGNSRTDVAGVQALNVELRGNVIVADVAPVAPFELTELSTLTLDGVGGVEAFLRLLVVEG